jgi:hypothetical protein
MVAYKYFMPSGISGIISRPSSTNIIESRMLDGTTPPLAFGVPVKLVANKMKPIEAGDVAASVAGILVRVFPTSGNGTDGLGAAVPNKSFPADLLRKGYISVAVNNFAVNAPAANGTVYVRVGNASGVKVIGGIEAAADVTAAAGAIVGTGNGTVAVLTATSATPAGVYTAKMTAATAFNVLDSGGAVVGSGATGGNVVLTNGLTVRINVGGTAFVAGDTIALTVTANTFALPSNVYFTGNCDAAGNAEVAYRI